MVQLPSNGPIDTYLWEQVSGPGNVELSVTDTDPAKATFAAPSAAGEYVFRLTITEPYVSSTSTTKVIITATQTTPDVKANAGTDRQISNKELWLRLMEVDQKMQQPTLGNK